MIFKQTRIGKDGQPFTIYKFRTMDDQGNITRPLLRRSGLDELPQLWNIVRGDMTLFGPRPEIPEIHDRCRAVVGPVWNERLRVKPGLLSLASVTGRIRTEARYTPDVKVEQAILDATMIEDLSWKMRWAILCRLPRTILAGQP